MTENKYRVTVIDDADDILELVSIALVRSGFEVQTYSNSKEGLDSIIANPPDLVILDIMVPELDGLEITRLIRNNKTIKQMPILAFTGKDSLEDRNIGYAAGINQYVVKPFSISALSNYVHLILENELS